VAGSSTPQCAVIGWPGQYGQGSAAAASQNAVFERVKGLMSCAHLFDLETLPAEFVPRTNYQRAVERGEFVRRQSSWDGKPYAQRYRQAHREFTSSGLERTVKSFLVAPGLTHVHTINSIALENDRATVTFTGLLNSLPYDYLIKVFGISHLTQSATDTLPLAKFESPLQPALTLRTLRLNALTRAYESIWTDLYSPAWQQDAFVAGPATVALGAVDPAWTEGSPLRTDLDRWLALTEIDAIVALMLGLSLEQLLQMYRSQFAVLRKYEFVTVFDANGRQISGIHHNYGFHQQAWEDALKVAPLRRGERRVGMWARVQAYLAGDHGVDLGPFEPPFVPADREKAMSAAYAAFAARLAAS
jgi:hypothetical protein